MKKLYFFAILFPLFLIVGLFSFSGSTLAADSWSGSMSSAGSPSASFTGVSAADPATDVSCSSAGQSSTPGSGGQVITVNRYECNVTYGGASSSPVPSVTVSFSGGDFGFAAGGGSIKRYSGGGSHTFTGNAASVLAGSLYDFAGGAASLTINYKYQAALPPATPSLALSVSPTKINASGGSLTISWQAANVSSCLATGAWSGNKSVAGGSETISISNPDKSPLRFILNCTSAQDPVSKYVDVVIEGLNDTPSFHSPGSGALVGPLGYQPWTDTDSSFDYLYAISYHGNRPVEIKIDNGSWQGMSLFEGGANPVYRFGPLSSSNLSEGSHNWQLRYQGSLAVTGSRSFIIDRTAPTGSISLTYNASAKTVTVNGSFSDKNGISGLPSISSPVYTDINGIRSRIGLGSTALPKTFSVADVPPGTTLEIVVGIQDNARNSSTFKNSVTIPSVTPPTLTPPEFPDLPELKNTRTLSLFPGQNFTAAVIAQNADFCGISSGQALQGESIALSPTSREDIKMGIYSGQYDGSSEYHILCLNSAGGATNDISVEQLPPPGGNISIKVVDEQGRIIPPGIAQVSINGQNAGFSVGSGSFTAPVPSPSNRAWYPYSVSVTANGYTYISGGTSGSAASGRADYQVSDLNCDDQPGESVSGGRCPQALNYWVNGNPNLPAGSIPSWNSFTSLDQPSDSFTFTFRKGLGEAVLNSLTATPVTVVSGTATNVSWTGRGLPESCATASTRISGNGPSDISAWNGDSVTSTPAGSATPFSLTMPTVTATTTYKIGLACGSNPLARITLQDQRAPIITVVPKPTTGLISLTATPSTVYAGDKTLIEWAGSGLSTKCESLSSPALAGWYKNEYEGKPTGGSYSLTAKNVTATSTFSLGIDCGSGLATIQPGTSGSPALTILPKSSKPEPPKSGPISGRVYNSSTKEGIAGVSIRVNDWYATTDPSGNWRLDYPSGHKISGGGTYGVFISVPSNYKSAQAVNSLRGGAAYQWQVLNAHCETAEACAVYNSLNAADLARHDLDSDSRFDFALTPKAGFNVSCSANPTVAEVNIETVTFSGNILGGVGPFQYQWTLNEQILSGSQSSLDPITFTTTGQKGMVLKVTDLGNSQETASAGCSVHIYSGAAPTPGPGPGPGPDPKPKNPVCGNGIIEAGEQCDDGNLTNGDGCSSVCQNEDPEVASISVSLSADPPELPAPGKTTLYWNSNLVIGNCKASGDWSGTKAASGSESVSVSQDSIFTIECEGKVTANQKTGIGVDTVSVTVGTPPAGLSVSLSANPSEIAPGESSTLSWTSTGPISFCNVNSSYGTWGGTRFPSGNSTVSPSKTENFVITCTDGDTNQSVSDNATIYVTGTSFCDDPLARNYNQAEVCEYNPPGAPDCPADSNGNPDGIFGQTRSEWIDGGGTCWNWICTPSGVWSFEKCGGPGPSDEPQKCDNTNAKNYGEEGDCIFPPPPPVISCETNTFTRNIILGNSINPSGFISCTATDADEITYTVKGPGQSTGQAINLSSPFFPQTSGTYTFTAKAVNESGEDTESISGQINVFKPDVEEVAP